MSSSFTAPRLSRRQILAFAASLPTSLDVAAQSPSRSSAKTLRIAQLLDSSADQQELSRDYATGVQLGLAEFNRGGRAIQLVSLNTDGSPASLKQALASVRDDPSICALLGTAGGRLAVESVAAARREGLAIAHVAPWMADSRFDADDDVFALFASREMQIRHALSTLGGMGVSELGLVYPSARDQSALHAEVAEAAGRLKLRTQPFVAAAGEDLAALGTRMGPQTPVILLFLGGTIELSRFTQGLQSLAARGAARYVVSLSDVDVPTLMQLSPSRSVPLILTQVVPNPQNSTLPAVQSYRSALKQLFDENPSHVSLGGYLAARYATHVLSRLPGTPTRAETLAEFRKRSPADLGGFNVSFGPQRRGSSFVTQTMLLGDGRLLG